MSHESHKISLDKVVKSSPNSFNAFGLEELAWEHFGINPESGLLEAARAEDKFLQSCAERCGGLEGSSVLELGPYEGYHTVLLESLGASEVISVEANPRNFLKCLVVKNHYGLDRARFLLGNLATYLEETTKRFDFISALGVLYHLHDPFTVLELMVERTDAIAVCTTYYHEEIQLFRFTGNTRQVNLPGLEPIVLHERQNPTDTLGKKHGTEQTAWMFTIDDLLNYFKCRNFDCETYMHREEPEFVRMRFLATRRPGSSEE